MKKIIWQKLKYKIAKKFIDQWRCIFLILGFEPLFLKILLNYLKLLKKVSSSIWFWIKFCHNFQFFPIWKTAAINFPPNRSFHQSFLSSRFTSFLKNNVTYLLERTTNIFHPRDALRKSFWWQKTSQWIIQISMLI